MIVELGRVYPSRYGAPKTVRVDTAIFTQSYFAHCLECPSCGDMRCDFGVDVEAALQERLAPYADSLEAYLGLSRAEWFAGERTADSDFPGGSHTRTRRWKGTCVFFNRAERGCLLHSFCLETGLDYHELKPMASCLFLLAFEGTLLRPSDGVRDGTLACLGEGLSLYRGVRADLLYYFGEDFVRELDRLERGK